jgi:hypothetical protein
VTSSARLGTAAAALLAVSGCAFSGIDLVRDTRLSLLGPKDGATVSLPFRIDWKVDKDIAPGHQVSYAVFVDRTPVKSGQTLRSAVSSTDTGCRSDPACPDVAYLARHDVYVVSQPHATIPRVPGADEKRKAHRVIVIILVDGKRDGEGAFSRTFYVSGASS